ncbi:hypothetical protein BS50DRAFT_159315 [Corynespora cassiicola Philippines]|uniref:Uncharacterized protein n=1 Tax=Corynespora cassiicola Philippines TaxID=1448308 RepID=A0A2T2N662_CORCC|nr:hypothetical protein BS50DRAFT_159315 [Corynespora cassiicola Philippines]
MRPPSALASQSRAAVSAPDARPKDSRERGLADVTPMPLTGPWPPASSHCSRACPLPFDTHTPCGLASHDAGGVRSLAALRSLPLRCGAPRPDIFRPADQTRSHPRVPQFFRRYLVPARDTLHDLSPVSSRQGGKPSPQWWNSAHHCPRHDVRAICGPVNKLFLFFLPGVRTPRPAALYIHIPLVKTYRKRDPNPPISKT